MLEKTDPIRAPRMAEGIGDPFLTRVTQQIPSLSVDLLS